MYFHIYLFTKKFIFMSSTYISFIFPRLFIYYYVYENQHLNNLFHFHFYFISNLFIATFSSTFFILVPHLLINFKFSLFTLSFM